MTRYPFAVTNKFVSTKEATVETPVHKGMVRSFSLLTLYSQSKGDILTLKACRWSFPLNNVKDTRLFLLIDNALFWVRIKNCSFVLWWALKIPLTDIGKLPLFSVNDRNELCFSSSTSISSAKRCVEFVCIKIWQVTKYTPCNCKMISLCAVVTPRKENKKVSG